MFPLAHSNYRDIFLFWKSPLSTHYSAIFSKNACIYIILKKYLLSKQIWNFFSLSGEQWNRTICHKARSTLAGCPYHHQGLLSKVQTLSIISPPTQTRTGKPITEHHILSVTSLPISPWGDSYRNHEYLLWLRWDSNPWLSHCSVIRKRTLF